MSQYPQHIEGLIEGRVDLYAMTQFKLNTVFLYIINSNDQINKLYNNGTLIKTFETFITKIDKYGNPYQLPCKPNSIAIDSLGNMYVTNQGNNSIEKFDNNGIYISSIINTGESNFNTPGLAVDSSGNLFYTRFTLPTIQKYDSKGNLIQVYGMDINGAIGWLIGIAVDSSGNVFVADAFDNVILKLDNNLNVLTYWGSHGDNTSSGGHFSGPWGVALDSSDNVYVTDIGNNRIHKFDNNGNFIAMWGSSGAGPGQFNGPTGIAVNKSSGAVDSSSGALHSSSAAVDSSSGNVYVHDTHNNRIQEFAPGSTGFLPDPNGYSFQNPTYGEISWPAFTAYFDLSPYYTNPAIFNDQGLTLTGPFLENFYKNHIKTAATGGLCFGMSGTSLLLYKNGADPNAYSYGEFSSPLFYSLLIYNNFYRNINNLPQNMDDWFASYQAISFDKAIQDYECNHKTARNGQYFDKQFQTIYKDLKKRLDSNDYSMVLNLQGKAKTLFGSFSLAYVIHAVVPYKIVPSPDGSSAQIYVYDSNKPGINYPNPAASHIDVDLTPGFENIHPYDFANFVSVPVDEISLVDLNSTLQPPTIPWGYTDLKTTGTASAVTQDVGNISHLLYTDGAGNKLGYYNGVFYNQIQGTDPVFPYGDNGNSNNPTESYYVPDPSIKMELYGNGSGISEVDMGTPNGLIIANVTMTPNSVDEFKILNNGTGVYFNSENDTTQSLGLMLDVETPNQAQIVNANLSQIEKGGFLNLSNNNGTIIIQNNGLQRTCDLSIQQVTSTQNSSININNIVIEGNSIVNIVPSNWNDIGNSTVTIEDIGSNGQVYYTEIISYQNGQVIPTQTTPAGILNNVIYVHPGKPAEFLNNVIDVPQTHSRNSEHDNDRHYTSYDSDIVPVRTLIDSEPIPMMYGSPINNPMHSSPMYASVPGGYGNEPYGTIDTPNLESNGHRAKAHLTKHNHKHHTTKHHKTGKNHLALK